MAGLAEERVPTNTSKLLYQAVLVINSIIKQAQVLLILGILFPFNLPDLVFLSLASFPLAQHIYIAECNISSVTLLCSSYALVLEGLIQK